MNRLFGPHRRELFLTVLAARDDTVARQRDREQERLQRSLDETTRRQANLLAQAQDRAPGDPFAAGLRESFNRLAADQMRLVAEIGEPAWP
ncbi:hypothetical protein [Streptomyces sp. NPDC021224]|uniref:hypothetical protein n=1 Tax=unclassified Streptomyces TaxID=2593676 RepID=UPI003798B079